MIPQAEQHSQNIEQWKALALQFLNLDKSERRLKSVSTFCLHKGQLNFSQMPSLSVMVLMQLWQNWCWQGFNVFLWLVISSRQTGQSSDSGSSSKWIATLPVVISSISGKDFVGDSIADFGLDLVVFTTRYRIWLMVSMILNTDITKLLHYSNPSLCSTLTVFEFVVFE